MILSYFTEELLSRNLIRNTGVNTNELFMLFGLEVAATDKNKNPCRVLRLIQLFFPQSAF